MSEVKVNKISPRSGTDVTLGDSGDTFTIPSGATILNSGTASGFGDNLEWQSSIVTAATITVVANRGYWLDTSSNAITVTLPGTAAVGDRLIFTDYARNWGTNAVTINQNSLKFQGGTTNPVYDTDGQSVDIVYSGTTKGWIPNSDDDVVNEGTLFFNIEYLLVAGGGGGGNSNAGGGGAGGLLTNYGGTAIALEQGSAYTATVGAGGAAIASGPNPGNAGTNSVLSGSGITTITAIGGGYGAQGNQVGGDGGSGGGGGYNNRAGGSGTAGQGNDGGTGHPSAPAYAGGGGGGKGAVGADATSSAGGNGGNGEANLITGGSITYAGGGGGATDPGQTQGSGGSGGGGAGIAYNGGTATSGTDGLGGGGGAGGGGSSASGAGGDGVVILRIATADYTGTVTGSPTVSADGTDTIIKFTGTGTYTA